MMLGSETGAGLRWLAPIVFALLLPATAAAQETKQPEAAAQPAQPSQAAWVVNCSSGPSDAGLVCQMSQNLTASQTGQRVLTVTVRKQPDGKLAMLLALPHGLYLPAGVSYQIDDGARQSVAIHTSDQNGSYAAVPLTDELVAGLRNGTSLKIGMESVARKPVTIPVTLAGFTAALDKLMAVN